MNFLATLRNKERFADFSGGSANAVQQDFESSGMITPFKQKFTGWQ